MITDVMVQEQFDVIQYTRSLPDEDVRRLIMLYQLTDDWIADVQSGELSQNHAQILRTQLSHLGEYYYKVGKTDKAQLAAMLHDAMFYAEHEGLTVAQIETLQLILIHFQWVILTQDDLRECTLKVYRAGIEVIPPMSDFEQFLALSAT